MSGEKELRRFAYECEDDIVADPAGEFVYYTDHAALVEALTREVEALRARLTKMDEAYMKEYADGQDLADKLAAAEARALAAEQDVARYRWLRDRIDADLVQRVAGINDIRGQAYEPYSVKVDAAIDAAISAKRGEGEV